jgi:MerR family transcriptional regulator, heat shock protein HspR
VGEGAFPADDPDYPIYTVAQATELLGVNPPTLRRWEREGLVSPRRSEGGQRRYSRRDLEQLKRVARLAGEGVTTTGIRRVLELQDRVDRLEDRLAAREAADRREREANEERPGG